MIDLPSYLRRTFTGLTLGDGLFYRWPIGIRFELGGRGPDPRIMSMVKQRALKLYESVFSPDDDCVVVSYDLVASGEGWDSHDYELRRLGDRQSLVDFAKRLSIGLRDSAQQVEADDPDESKVLLQWVVQPSRSLRYDAVLEGIANADHGIIPSIGSWVCFLNVQNDVIFHMYDDRGLDVIATKRDALLPLYRNFNSWILDYDRAQIDRCFGHPAPGC